MTGSNAGQNMIAATLVRALDVMVSSAKAFHTPAYLPLSADFNLDFYMSSEPGIKSEFFVTFGEP